MLTAVVPLASTKGMTLVNKSDGKFISKAKEVHSALPGVTIWPLVTMSFWKSELLRSNSNPVISAFITMGLGSSNVVHLHVRNSD